MPECAVAILSDHELRDEILRREPVNGIRIVGVDGKGRRTRDRADLRVDTSDR